MHGCIFSLSLPPTYFHPWLQYKFPQHIGDKSFVVYYMQLLLLFLNTLYWGSPFIYFVVHGMSVIVNYQFKLKYALLVKKWLFEIWFGRMRMTFRERWQYCEASQKWKSCNEYKMVGVFVEPLISALLFFPI